MYVGERKLECLKRTQEMLTPLIMDIVVQHNDSTHIQFCHEAIMHQLSKLQTENSRELLQFVMSQALLVFNGM